MLQEHEFMEIKQSFANKLKFKSLTTHLEFGDRNRLYCNDELFGIYSKKLSSKTDNYLNILTLNCGDTEGKDQKLDEKTNRIQSLIKYVDENKSDVYLLNDITLTSELVEQIYSYSWLYVPTLFKSDITKSSGLLIVTSGDITNCSIVLPPVVPQGEKAREAWLIELYHPVLTAKIRFGIKEIVAACYYVSFYSNQSQRIKFQEIMLREINKFQHVHKIKDVFVGGDANAYGWTVPYLPKKLAILSFLPIIGLHLITRLFVKRVHNLLSESEFKQLKNLGLGYKYRVYPSKFTPTISKAGVPFMCDYLYYDSDLESSNKVIPGVYSGKDHDALYSTFRLSK